ncbi:cadherin-23-like isoform X2 [Saccostrea cucullata]|uniref:cadherin-23-like isoform X2 n=1 Tax=Saccostrea cuccullata TaxID=36930 RepID=UPI002ED2847F
MKKAFLLHIAFILVSSTCRFTRGQLTPPHFDQNTAFFEYAEGNYTDNPALAFTLNASVSNPNLNVTIRADVASSNIVYVNNTHTRNIGNRVAGHVYLMTNLDREMKATWDLVFFAQSSNPSLSQAILRVTLSLIDVNDESPVFSRPAYQITIQENYTVGTRVANSEIVAKDPDMGIGGHVTYAIKATGQAEELYKGYFNICTEFAGAYLVLKKELDYETLTFLQYEVVATDGTHNSTAELLVKVQDVQDKPPVFLRLPYIKSVSENVNGAIFTVKAVDGDLGIPREVKYGLINDSCASYLSINETTGEIGVIKELDRDSGEIHQVGGVCSIKVEAYETGTKKSNETQSITDLTLTIVDVNDNPPTFSNQTYEGFVVENTTGISITFSENIQVEDIDQNGYNTIKLSVLHSNMTEQQRVVASPVEIIGKGIVLLRVNQAFDFEEEKSVQLVVNATDKQNSSLFSTSNITIRIKDANDNDPVFENNTYEFDVSENSCNGTPVGKINASDADSDDFGNISYSINGADNGFGIDTKSGQIYVASNESCRCIDIQCEESLLDRERISKYYLTMEAQDGGGRRTPVSVVIRLMDENDNSPEFRDESYEFSIKEKSNEFSSGKNYTILTAIDGDKLGTNNSRVSYCFSDEGKHCANDEYFKIDKNGTITITKQLDFENLTKLSDSDYREHNLKVMAYDHGIQSMNSTVGVTIIVQDVNDHNPTFSGNFEGRVKENSPSGTYILSVSAEDGDGTAPNNEVSYFIFLGGSDQFKMDGNSGNLSVQVGAKLDRESVSSYNLTIIAIDKGNPQLTGTTNVTLIIDDVNDTPPELLNLPAREELVENAESKIIFRCNSSDKDIDSLLSYSIQIKEAYDYLGQKFNASKDYFTINNATGEISARNYIDAEKELSFVLSIVVTDTKTHINYSDKAKAELIVNVTDMNDNPPVFTAKSLSAGILRNSPYNTAVLDMKEFVTDQDVTEKHRRHKFYMLNITNHGLKDIPSVITTGCKKAFCVTENGTVLSNFLFTGKGSMEVGISVNDTAGSSETTLDIYIIDESQQLSMHFRRPKNDVNKVQEYVLRNLSAKIGYKCVFDGINPYQDEEGNIIEFESLLTFHVIDEKERIVLDAIFVQGVLDQYGDDLKDFRNHYGVAAIGALQITDVKDTGSKIKETYILVAVIVLLTLILAIVIYFYITSISKSKRKLKAATISSTEKKNGQILGDAVIPGSNMFSKNKNPLIDKEEEIQRTIGNQDNVSLAGSEESLDFNEVEYDKGNYYLNQDPVEEKEAVLEMYGEDGGVPIGNEDDMALLKQALQQHDKLASENGNGGSKGGGLDVIEGKVNEGYEIVEATDV